jgi:hypothetical protein
MIVFALGDICHRQVASPSYILEGEVLYSLIQSCVRT